MSYQGGMCPADKGANAISLIDAVYRWCESLKGQAVFETALKAIVDGVGAEAVALSRLRHDRSQSVKSVPYDRMPASSPLPRLKRAFSTSVLGEFTNVARTGTVWLRSAIEVDADPALDLFFSRRNLRELAVIPLATGQRVADFLEIHFAHDLTPNQHAMLNSLAQTLSEAWRSRSDGVFVANLLDSGNDERHLNGADLLGHENPVRLSRAEYRVCLLLSRGLPIKAVGSELSISHSTLRTHLRNIYLKTSTRNLPELLYLLLSGSGPLSDSNVKSRIA